VHRNTCIKIHTHIHIIQLGNAAGTNTKIFNFALELENRLRR
jgi:hypothetical protein